MADRIPWARYCFLLLFVSSPRSADGLITALKDVRDTVATVGAEVPPCDCSGIPTATLGNSTSCCGRAEGIAQEQLEERLRHLEDEAAADREARITAIQQTQGLIGDTMRLKDEELAAKLRMAVRNASETARQDAEAKSDDELKRVAREASEAARVQAERQYEKIDAARAAKQSQEIIRQQEIGDANKAMDQAVKEAIETLTDSTAKIVRQSTAAASASAMAKATAQAAMHVEETARMQGIQAKVAAASAAAAKQRAEDLSGDANTTAAVASRAADLAAQDEARAREATNAYKYFLQDSEAAKVDAVKAIDDSTSTLGALTENVLERLSRTQSEAARSVQEATKQYEEILEDVTLPPLSGPPPPETVVPAAGAPCPCAGAYAVPIVAAQTVQSAPCGCAGASMAQVSRLTR